MTRSTIVAIALLALANRVEGQEVGDSVRVRGSKTSAWAAGRMLSLDSNTIRVRSFAGDSAFQLRGVERAERWKRTNKGVAMILGAVAGGAGYAIANSQTDKDTRSYFTGSLGGDVAVFALGGATINLIFAELVPGKWKRFR